MAEHIQSDSPVVIRGKEYLLRWKFLALEIIEGAKASGDIESNMASVKWVFYAGLRKHHPAITLQQAAEILDDADDFVKAVEDIMTAFRKATGQSEAGDASKKKTPAKPKS